MALGVCLIAFFGAPSICPLSYRRVPRLGARQGVYGNSTKHCFFEAVAHCWLHFPDGKKCGLAAAKGIVVEQAIRRKRQLAGVPDNWKGAFCPVGGLTGLVKPHHIIGGDLSDLGRRL